MNLNLIILLFLLFAGVIGAGIFLAKKYLFDKDFPTNKEMIINLLSDYTDGYALLVKDKERRTKDKVIILANPRDINYAELENNPTLKINKQNLFISKPHYLDFPISRHRNLKIALPPKPEQIPEELKSTPLGILFMGLIEAKRQDKDEEYIKGLAYFNRRMIDEEDRGWKSVKRLHEQNIDVLKDLKEIIRSPSHIDKDEDKK